MAPVDHGSYITWEQLANVSGCGIEVGGANEIAEGMNSPFRAYTLKQLKASYPPFSPFPGREFKLLVPFVVHPN